MVLYHVYSEYNVFQAYIHKKRFHNLESAILLIGPSKEIQVPRLLEGDNNLVSPEFVKKCRKLFDKVVLCNNPPAYYEDNKKLEESIDEYYSNIFMLDGIDKKDSKAYTFCSYERFSIFCIYNKIPLSVFELEPGCISVLQVIMDFEKKYFNHKYLYINKYKLYLCEDNVVSKICNFEAQEDNVCLDGYIDFNPYREMQFLDKSILSKLEEFYAVKPYFENDLSNEVVLVAGNEIMKDVDPYVNHGHFLYTEEKQIMANNLILDLFSEHKKSVMVVNGINNHYNYERICPQAKYYLRNIPIEIIAYYLKDTNNLVISALRQDGYCFKNSKAKYLEITSRFLPSWQKYRFFDSAIEIDMFMNFVKYVNSDKIYKVSYYNVSNIIQKLYEIYFEEKQSIEWVDIKKTLEGRIVFVNDGNYDEKELNNIPTMINSSANSVYFFANQREVYAFLDKKNKYEGKIISFLIKIKQISHDCRTSIKNKRIWIYCTEKNISKKIESFCYKKVFNNCGIEVESVCDSYENTHDVLKNMVVPRSVLSAKSIVIYGDSNGINKYYDKVSMNDKKIYICRYDECSEGIDDRYISRDKLGEMNNAFILIATDEVGLIEKISAELNKLMVAYDHCEHYITGNISIQKLVAMKRYDYIDDKNNHYMIDNRLKWEDAKKIVIDFYQGKPRYNNSFKIGMIRIVGSLKISVKGDYNKIVIGDDTTFQSVNMEICQNASINIGKKCMFSYGIILYRDDMHNIYDLENLERINYPKDINIGNHVWLGRECMLLGGASIGNNCVVGARCVTSSKFSSNVIIAGCPGKVVRENIIWSRDGYESGASNLYDNFDRSFFEYDNQS